jgi:hypothetical protein
VSGIFSGFLVSFALARGGVSAALALIAGCMRVVALSVGLLGPRTRGQSLEVLTGDGHAVDVSAATKPANDMPILVSAQSK